MTYLPRTWILAALAALLFVATAFIYYQFGRDSTDGSSFGGESATGSSAANISALTAQLQSADPTQAVTAAQSLSQSRNPDAVHPLLAAVQDTRTQVQVAAIIALARLQPKIDPAPFIQLVETTPQPAVRAAALDYLAINKVLAACPLMLKYLDDPDVEVRGRAYAGIHALTGRNYHYHADDPPEKRADAIRAIHDSVIIDGRPLPVKERPHVQ